MEKEGPGNREAVSEASLEARAKKAKAKHAEGRAAASATLLASIKERIVRQLEETPVGAKHIVVVVRESEAWTPILKWLVHMDFRVEAVRDDDGDPRSDTWNVLL
jgi:hypothetical protein